MTARDSLLAEVVAPENLMRAWRQVRRNVQVAVRPFSKGMDGVSVTAFERGLDDELGRLGREMRSGDYVPTPVRWVHIPKPGEGRRTIGILAVRDRVAQRAVHQVLAPRLDDLFLPCSYGFRPGRSGSDAVSALNSYRAAGDTWALVADIEGCFDGLDHRLLLGALREHVHERKLLGLIKLWLASDMIGRPEPAPRVQLAPAGWDEDGAPGTARGLGQGLGLLGMGAASSGELEYAPFEGTGRPGIGADTLMLGSALAGPLLRRSRRFWPAAGRLLQTPVGAIGAIGVAIAVAAPLVWRAAANAARERGVGVLQGSALSPLLTNLYLHSFDVQMVEEGLHLVRYADDLAISCLTEAEARRARWTCIECLRRLHLRLNEDKTGLVQWSHGFEYLGAHMGGATGGREWPHYT